KDAHGELILKLVKTPDILKTMGQKKGHRLVVGFAAETTALVENGMAELKKKYADLIVANDVTWLVSAPKPLPTLVTSL
ncbi:phosphopantothenoylcysteine decarboxylase, partial [Shigella sonnei]|nr:phosphopantothenoylcysteine decarboxylase [Shigella sonnei]